MYKKYRHCSLNWFFFLRNAQKDLFHQNQCWEFGVHGKLIFNTRIFCKYLSPIFSSFPVIVTCCFNLFFFHEFEADFCIYEVGVARFLLNWRDVRSKRLVSDDQVTSSCAYRLYLHGNPILLMLVAFLGCVYFTYHVDLCNPSHSLLCLCTWME